MADTKPIPRSQDAYRALSSLLDHADGLLDSGVHNEDELREAFAEAEDLLLDLDAAEAELIEEIRRAKEGPK